MNALRTIALRLRSTKVELEEMGEDAIGAAESSSKLREQIMALSGVDIMTNADEYKGVYQVLEEISKVWKNISDIDQAALLELLAGKNRANILAGLLNNFNDAEAALTDAMNAEGSALRENEKILDSIQGKINQFQAAWESLSATVVNSELVKGIIDFGTGVIKVLDSIIGALGSIETVLGGIFGVGVAKSAIAGFVQAIEDGHGAALKGTAVFNLLGSSLQGFGIAAAAIVGIKIAKWLYDVAFSTNKAREAVEEYNTAISNLQTNEKTFKTTAERFQELASQTTLTAEETEEYYEVQNKLHDLMPELAGYYDSNKNFIVTESEYVSDLVDLYNELIVSKQKAAAVEYTKENILGKSAFKDDYQDYRGLLSEYATAEWARDLFVKEAQLKEGESLSTDEALTLAGFESEYGSEAGALSEMKRVQAQMDAYIDEWSKYVSYFVADNDDYTKLDSKSKDAFAQIVSSFSADKLYETLIALAANDYSVISNVKGTTAYKDLVDGKMDNMSAQERDLTVQAGGVNQADALVQEYVSNQKAIQQGHYAGRLITDEETAALAEQLLIIRKIREETEKTQKDPASLTAGDIDITTYSDLKDQVNSLGEAYVEFIENGNVSLETLEGIQDAFSTCSDEWNNFVDVLSSGDATASDVKSSAESLAEAYLDQKLALGEVNLRTKDHIAAMLQQIGVENAEMVAHQAVAQQVASEVASKHDATVATDELTQEVEQELKALGIEGAAADLVQQACLELKLAKIAASDDGFLNMTAQEIDELLEEAMAAKLAATEISKLQSVKQARAIVDAFEANESQGGTYNTADVIAYNNALQTLQDTAVNANFEDIEFNVNLNTTDAVQNAREASGKISEAFQNMYDELQFMREANLISEAEYLSRLAQLNEQYNRNNLATYRKYAMEIFNTMKSAMSDRISSQYDAQIDALEAELDAYDDQIDALNEQREETEKYYDGLIEAEQEKLDLLKEEWETEEYLLKIEQARMALARAQQQKNVRVYREGQGFVWENDQQEVNDLRAEVNSAIQEYNRYLQELAIEKRIDEIEELKEKAIESIEAQIKAIEKAKEAVQKAIEAAQKAKEQALKDLEDMKFGGEAFLMFCEMFGIEITDDILAIADSFDQLAKNGELDLKKVQDAAGKTTNALTPLLEAKLDDDSAFNTMGEAMDNLNTASTEFSESAQTYLDTLRTIAEESPDLIENQGKYWTSAFTVARAALDNFRTMSMDAYNDTLNAMSQNTSTQLALMQDKFRQMGSQIASSLVTVMTEMEKLTVMITGESTGVDLSGAEALAGDAGMMMAPDGMSVIDNAVPGSAQQNIKNNTTTDMKTVKSALEDLIGKFDELVGMLTKDLPGAIQTAMEELEKFRQKLDETTTDVGELEEAVGNLQSAINQLHGTTIYIDVITRYSETGTQSGFESTVDLSGVEAAADKVNKTGKTTADSTWKGTTIRNPFGTPSVALTARDKQSEKNDVFAPFASGVINLPRSVNALTDELGPELIIPGKGTFRKLKMGTSVLPADISRNLWAMGQNPIGFASGIASMISNKKEENKVYQMTFGSLELPNVHNARDFADELKSLVRKAEQLAFSK